MNLNSHQKHRLYHRHRATQTIQFNISYIVIQYSSFTFNIRLWAFGHCYYRLFTPKLSLSSTIKPKLSPDSINCYTSIEVTDNKQPKLKCEKTTACVVQVSPALELVMCSCSAVPGSMSGELQLQLNPYKNTTPLAFNVLHQQKLTINGGEARPIARNANAHFARGTFVLLKANRQW